MCPRPHRPLKQIFTWRSRGHVERGRPVVLARLLRLLLLGHHAPASHTPHSNNSQCLERVPISSTLLHFSTADNTNSKQGGRSSPSTSVVNSQSHAAGGRTSPTSWLANTLYQTASDWLANLVLPGLRSSLQRYKTCILTRPPHWSWRHPPPKHKGTEHQWGRININHRFPCA